MDPISILGLVSILLIVIIAVVTLKANASALMNRAFFLFAVLVATWAGLVFSENVTTSQRVAAVLVHIDFAVASSLMMSWVLFSWSFKHVGAAPPRTSLALSSAVALTFTVLSCFDLIITNIRIEKAAAFDTGPLFLFFAAYVIVAASWGLILIGQKYFSSRGAERSRALYVLVGLLLSFLITIATNIIYPKFFPASVPISRIGLASLIFMVAFPSYAILRYRLMDVTLVLRRTASYAIILSLIVGAYALVVFILSDNLKDFFNLTERGIQIVALLVLAVSILPLKWLVDRYLNRYLFHGTYDPRELMKEAEGLLSLKEEMETALSSLGRRLCTAMGLESAAFLIFSEADPEQTILNVYWKLGDIATEYVKTPLEPQRLSFLLENRENIVVRDELAQRISKGQAGRYSSPESLLRQMDALSLGISLPISFRDQVSGLLVLGEKVNRRDFSTQDIDFLRSLTQRVAYVVDHHRLYEELKHKYQELDAAYEQLKDIDRFKSDIITITNHELRGPLTLIVGYLDLLNARLETIDEGKRREFLMLAKKGADRLARIVDDLRIVTDIEMGRLHMDMDELNLHELALEAEAALGIEAPVEFQYDFAGNLPSIYGDRQKVAVVFRNLMDNAFKFAGKYGPINVGAYPDKDGVVVFVKDQGPGMRKEYLDSIFGLFSFIGDSDHHSEEGLGLGLHIARKLVEMHDGRIWGESELEKGSSFFVFLPSRQASDGGRPWQSAQLYQGVENDPPRVMRYMPTDGTLGSFG